MRAGVSGPRVDRTAELRRRMVTITASGRRPPRLNGVVSLSAECIEVFHKE